MPTRRALAIAAVAVTLACAAAADESTLPAALLSNVGLPPEPRIALDREVIRIRHHDETSSQEWSADCSLTFRNLTHDELDVVMGQPDWQLIGHDYVDWVLTEFETSVDGSDIPAERSCQLDGGVGPVVQDYANCAWSWTVHFRPRATVQVRTRYRFQRIDSVGPIDACVADRDDLADNPPFWAETPASSSDKAFGCCHCASVSYMGHGGRTWAQPIGKAEIIIDRPETSGPHRLAFFPPPTRVDRNLATWRFKQWLPVDVRIVSVHPRSEVLFELPEQARAWTAYAERNHLTRDAILALVAAYTWHHEFRTRPLGMRAAFLDGNGVRRQARRTLEDPTLSASDAEIIRELLRAAARAPR